MYRVGRKTKRAVLDQDGLEIVVFNKGQEQMAQEFVNYLNDKLTLTNVVGRSEELADFKCPPNERCKNVCDECAVANGSKQG